MEKDLDRRMTEKPGRKETPKPAGNPGEMIELADVRKHYEGRAVLDGVPLEIARGRVRGAGRAIGGGEDHAAQGDQPAGRDR